MIPATFGANKSPFAHPLMDHGHDAKSKGITEGGKQCEAIAEFVGCHLSL